MFGATEEPFSLVKGQTFDLTKRRPALAAVTVGLGWKARNTHGGGGSAFDLDASAIPLGPDGKYYGDRHMQRPTDPRWFVYFNDQTSPGDLIKSAGDDLEGSSGDDDDESIDIQLAKLPTDMTGIVIPISIYDAESRRQNFGQVGKAYCRIVDQRDGTELARYDLAEEYSLETAVVCAELTRTTTGWGFTAVGQGYSDNLPGICRAYGVPV